MSTPVATTRTIPEMLAIAAGQTAIIDALKKAQTRHRGETFSMMMEAREGLGIKSFDVKVAGEVHAGATITEPSDKFEKPKVGADLEAYLSFMEENYPEQVYVEVKVHEAFEKKFLESLETVDGESGTEVFDPQSGQSVPGVAYLKASDPTSWSMRFKKGDESKSAVLRAMLPPEAQKALGIVPDMGELPAGDEA